MHLLVAKLPSLLGMLARMSVPLLSPLHAGGAHDEADVRAQASRVPLPGVITTHLVLAHGQVFLLTTQAWG